MNAARVLEPLAIAAVLGPAVLLALLGVPAAIGRPLREKAVGRLTSATMLTCFTCLFTALAVLLAAGSRPVMIEAGTWFRSGEGIFRFDFLIDRLSLAFGTLSAGICGVVAAFSFRYLHREPGYTRYFLLFATFVLGIMLVSLAGSIEVLFAGWELLGLSSALLVGFFHERPAPVTNALRVFAVYRVGDAAMLGAAVLLHHSAGGGSLSFLFPPAIGPEAPGLRGLDATIIGLLLVIAVAGKSALLPFSGWLPRAMEGPTPSSAVYYGAISIHAGCFLLLRAGPVLEQSAAVRVVAGVLGLATAIYATLCGRVQTDVKSALAYASLTQVGVIVVEISLGFYAIAFLHLAGNASFRLLQFLSAPSVLHDLHDLKSAPVPRRSWRQLYLWALERGLLDAMLDRWVVAPFCRTALLLDRFDRKLAGRRRRPGREQRT